MKKFVWRMMGAVLFSALLAAALSWVPVLIQNYGAVPDNVTVFQPRTAVILGKENLVDFIIQQSWSFQLKKVNLHGAFLQLEMEAKKTIPLYEEIEQVVHQIFMKTQNIHQVQLVVDTLKSRLIIEVSRSDWKKYQSQRRDDLSVEENIRRNYHVTESPLQSYGN